MVEVGDPVSRERHDQRGMLLVLRNGRVERVVLGVVGALVASAARLSPEEARHVRREERGVVAAAAGRGRRPSALRMGISGRAP